jgi:hypothetical protein
MRTHKTDFKGVAVYTGLHYPEHVKDIRIGILCDGVIPEADDLQDFVESVKFRGSDEQYCSDLLLDLDMAVTNKGLLVYVAGHITCASVSGEVLRDADVKFEMYKLMGL